MAENIFSSFAISGQGLSVQRMRLSATANNIANANTTKGPNGQPYQREVTIVRHIPGSPFEKALESQIELSRSSNDHAPNGDLGNYPPDYSVLQSVSARDNSAPRLVYDPSHPDADTNGYVKMPNINVVTEMVEMISAQRAFEAGTQVIQSAKSIASDSLNI